MVDTNGITKLTVKEIAFLEGVSTDTVYRWCDEGFLRYSRRPSKKGKGNIVISQDNYEQFKEIFQ